MKNLIIALSCVLPTFIYMLVGYYAKSRRLLPQEVYPQINRLAFNVLLPFTMFVNIYSADLSLAFSPKMLGYMMAANVTLFLLAIAVTKRTILDQRRRGLYIQNSYRSNIAIIGITLAESLAGTEGTASMSIAVTVLVPLANAMAIIALELCRGGKVSVKKLVVNILKNPLIVGALLGAATVAVGIRLPGSVEKAVKNLGSCASVITMVALGATFQFGSLRAHLRELTITTLTRLVFAPGAVIGAAILLGFRGVDLAVILLCAATPIATSVYPMALVYDSDAELSGELVITTSLFCCLTLFLWIFALKQLGVI